MKNSKVEICFIGNAIVDILSKVSFETLDELQIPKGAMQLVDEELSDKILKHIQDSTIISGGSAANTAVGFKSFGGKCSFIGQIGNDKFGDLFAKILRFEGFPRFSLSCRRRFSSALRLVGLVVSSYVGSFRLLFAPFSLCGRGSRF